MTDKQRAAFEAWASGYDVQMFIDRSRHDKSLYAHAETNDAWAAWQAGIEHAETRMNRAGSSDSGIDLPPLPEAEIDDAGAFMSDAQVMSIESAKEYARVAVEHDRKRRGEPVGIMREPDQPGEEPWPEVWADLSAGTELYAAPQPPEPTIDAPAQVGNVRFGKGVKQSTVIAAAQRHHDYMNTPEKEQERIRKGAESLKKFHDCVTQPAEPESDTFVQKVPDHCDRITWKGRYYSLPLETAEPDTRLASEVLPDGSAVKQVRDVDGDVVRYVFAEPVGIRPVDVEKNGATVTLHFESSEAAARWHANASTGIALRENAEPVEVPSDAELRRMVQEQYNGDPVEFARAVLACYGHPVEPEGWQLVPKTPTVEMITAMREAIVYDQETTGSVYVVMLEAAPKFGEEE